MLKCEKTLERNPRIRAFWFAVLTLGAGFITMMSAVPSRAVTIAVNPSEGAIAVGGSFEVRVEISGLGHLAAPSVSVIDLDLSFDPAVLSATDGSLGDPILGDQLDVLGLGSLAIATVGVGTINFFELSYDLPTDLDSLQAGAFVFGTVTFEAVGEGTSALSLSINSIGDALGDPLPVDTSGSSVVVVPEPAASVLLAAGLAGLAAARRRRSRH